MSKQPRSFSIDEDVHEILSSRDDLNASAAVNKFLREFVSSGKAVEAALEVRREQLDEEISDAKRKLQRLERERDRIEDQLESRQTALDEKLNSVEEKVRRGEFPRERINTDNPAIHNWASDAGVNVDRFVDELEARIGGD